MIKAYAAIMLLFVFSISGIASASYYSFIPKSYYTYYNLNSTTNFSLGVYYNVSNASILLIIPSSELYNYTIGSNYNALYQMNVSSYGLDLFNLSAGSYEVILYAPSYPVSYEFYVEQGKVVRHYQTSHSFNYTLHLANYSLLNISYLSTAPATVISEGQSLGFPSNYGGYTVDANRGIYNATIIPTGPSDVYVFATVTPTLVNPLNLTNKGKSVGLVYYGFNANGTVMIPEPIKTGELVGVARIRSISAYNSSPPQNSSQFGAGLQLNAMLYINSPRGNATYWIQNVLSLNTSSGNYSLNDNVWNSSTEYASVKRSIVSGSGSFLNVQLPNGTNQRIYAYQTQRLHYSLPQNFTLVTNVTYSSGIPVIHFGYSAGGPVVYYDNVSVNIPSSSAYMLATPFYEAPDGNFNDFEFVFGGSSNGEVSYFNSMNASIMLYYSSASSFKPFPSYLTFGSDTEEGAANLEVKQSQEGALVTAGIEDYYSVIIPQEAKPIKVYTTTVTTTVPSTTTISQYSSATTSLPYNMPPQAVYTSIVSLWELVAVLIVLVIVLLIIGVVAHKRANR
ncbi:MAG: thermopsin family protease [Candidatus Micrarchaeaceae archaeon]